MNLKDAQSLKRVLVQAKNGFFMSSLSYLATSILSHVVCSVHLQKTLGKFGKSKENKTR
jgi:hypothetical protein